MRAPADGVLINVGVQVGQQVPAGSVLFEVANLDPVYIKVPVFVGEEETIDPTKDAAIGGLADALGKPTRPAKAVRTTPSANALTTTVDLYYEVENHDGKLRPGQKVGVILPLKGEDESLVVPYASILYDFNGGPGSTRAWASMSSPGGGWSSTTSSAAEAVLPSARSPGPRSSPTAPPSCSAPSSAGASDDDSMR